MVERVLLGGTFDGVHLGHHKLLDTAFEIGGKVTIGLVTDEMLKKWKPEVNKSFDERKEILSEILSTKEDWTITPISDPYSQAVEGDHDTLVVSWETAKRGQEINSRREKIGKRPLKLVVVEPVLADDLLPVSSTRIRQGIINSYGKRLKPVKIHTYTEDPKKISIIDEVMRQLLGDIELVSEPNPHHEITPLIETTELKASVPDDYDYGVGLDSGTLSSDHGSYMIEIAMVKDEQGRVSTGHGPGFLYPKHWPEDITDGINLLQRIKVNFSGETSQIDLLTERTVGKRDCFRSALLMAMIPRMSGDLYVSKALQDH